MNVYLASVGCKLNQSEAETLARKLSACGHRVVSDPVEADTIILNTCTVTHIAARKSGQLVRRLHRANTDAQIVLTGCFAEMSPDDAAALPGVRAVVGNADKERLLERLGFCASTAGGSSGRHVPLSSALRTRAFVKIQDGCDNECTYCIVRIARGRQRSRGKDDIIAEIQQRVSAGYQEVVLTGVHIGAYGRDHNQTAGMGLWDLVYSILQQTSTPRLRLSSIEPWDIAPQHLALWQDRRLCRHLHLPLQSGSDVILARMKRHYTVREFADTVEATRKLVPDMAITTDVIVGFPGETESQFEETLRFVEAMQFSRVHIFPYSARPGTEAAAYPDQVSPEVRQVRAQRLAEIAQASERAFWQRFLGQTVEVLWESRREAQVWSGLTDHYVRVMARSEKDLHNRITSAHITGLAPKGLWGELLVSADRLETDSPDCKPG